MADETVTTGEAESFITHMRKKVARSQEAFPDDWRYRFTFYDGEVANLLDEMQQPTQVTEPRAIIQHFAAAMERKMALRDETHGSWRQSDVIELMDALLHEVEELRAAWVMRARYSGPAEDVLMEAVDVAAYAMFIADVCGALPPTDERGR